MLKEEQGIEAIISLQKTVGVNESYEKAKNGWKKMSEHEKEQTELAHKAVCGGFKGCRD